MEDYMEYNSGDWEECNIEVSASVDISKLDDDALEDLTDGIFEIVSRDACNRDFDVYREIRGGQLIIEGEFSEGAFDDLQCLLEDLGLKTI